MLSLHDIRAALRAELSKIYAPGCTLNCWEWAESNILIPPEESPDRHGPFDSSLQPIVRRLMEFITNPNEKEFIIRKSAQIGFTLACLIIIAYLAVNRATHVIYGMPSAKDAADVSRRLVNILEYNDITRGVFTDDPDDVSKLFVRLRGMYVWLVGAGAAGAFRQKAAGIVFLDELDAHEEAPNQQANTIDLARGRVKDAECGKLVAGGTPVLWEGETNQNYLTGTREEIHVPCPFCDTYQPIRWDRIKFGHCKNEKGEYDYARMELETYLDCVTPGCSAPGRRILDEHKPQMLRRYRCVATNTGQDEWKPFPGRVSIWVNDLYSVRPQHAWGKLAQKWVDAQTSPSKVRAFFNEVLGLPQSERRTQVKRDELYKLCGAYDHGCVPVMPAKMADTGAAALFMAVDVQGSGQKKWVKAAFLPNGECFTVDYGKCLTYDELLLVADLPVRVGERMPSEDDINQARRVAEETNTPLIDVFRERLGGEWLTVQLGFIDEGHETTQVRRFCLETADPVTGQPRFFPCKGSELGRLRDIVDEKRDKFFVEGVPITVYHLSDDDLKDELYLGRIGMFEQIKAGNSRVPRLWFPNYPDAEFLTELTTERRGQIMKRGRLTWVWLPPKSSEANDFGDALKYILALWHVVKALFQPPPEPPPVEEADEEKSAD